MRAAPRFPLDHLNLRTEDLIEPQDVVVTLSHSGYAKAQPVSDYQAQRRGGRGKSATAMKEEDFIETLFVAHTHDTLLCFSSRGRLYWLRVFELPQAGRAARGKPMVNLLPLAEGEKINAVLPIKQFDESTMCSWPRATARSRRRRCRRSRGRAPAASLPWTCATTTSWSKSKSPTVRARSCCLPVAARPSVSARRKCGRWDAIPLACAA